MLGDKIFNLIDDDLIINDKRFTVTLGLYKLIIMAEPVPYVFTAEDFERYLCISAKQFCIGED